VPTPAGIGEAEVRKAIAELRALGEINNIPPVQLDPILERAEREMREKPDDPGRRTGPPPAPLLNP